MKSIKHIICCCAALSLLTAAVIVFTTYFSSRSALLGSSRDLMEQNAEMAELQLIGYIEAARMPCGRNMGATGLFRHSDARPVSVAKSDSSGPARRA